MAITPIVPTAEQEEALQLQLNTQYRGPAISLDAFARQRWEATCAEAVRTLRVANGNALLVAIEAKKAALPADIVAAYEKVAAAGRTKKDEQADVSANR